MSNGLAQAILDGAKNPSLSDLLAGQQIASAGLLEAMVPLEETAEDSGKSVQEDAEEGEKIDPREAQFHAELSRGLIPEELAETWRLVDPDSPPGRVFQATIEKFAREIYSKHHDFDREPVRFLLSASSEPFACRIRYAEPPIIMLSRGRFELQESEQEPLTATPDDLAIVLIHELTHQETRKRYGEGVKNSKIEESIAYVRPLTIMHDAGLNPERAPHYYDKLLKEKSYHFGEYLYRLLDPHPLEQNVKRLVVDALAYLRKERGELKPEKEARPYREDDALMVAVFQATHESFLQRTLRLGHPEYDGLDGAGKLNALHQIFLNMGEYYAVRLNDLAEEIKRISGEIDRVKDRPSIGGLIDDVLYRYESHPEESNPLLYRQLAQLAEPDVESAPLGRLEALSTGIERTIEAVRSGDSREIVQACEALVAMAKHEPLFRTEHGRDFLQSVSFSRFKFPDTDALDAESRRKDMIRELRQTYGRNKTVEELRDYVEPGEEDLLEEIEILPVEWQPLRKLAPRHECVAEAGFMLGLTWDPGLYESLSGHPDLAYHLFRRGAPHLPDFPQIVTELHSGSVSLKNFRIDEQGIPSDFDPSSDKPGTEECYKLRTQTQRGLAESFFLAAKQDPTAKDKLIELTKAFGESGAETGESYASGKLELLCIDCAEENLRLFQELNFPSLEGNKDAQSSLLRKFGELLRRDSARFAPLIKADFYRLGSEGAELNPLIRRSVESHYFGESGGDERKAAGLADIPVLERYAYLNFLIRDSFGIFTADEKYLVVEANTTHFVGDCLTLAEPALAHDLLNTLSPLARAAGRLDVSALTDFTKLNAALRKLQGGTERIQHDEVDFLPQHYRALSLGLTRCMCALRAIELFESKKPTFTQFIEFVPLLGSANIGGMDTFKVNARPWVTERLNGEGLPKDLSVAIDAWSALHSADLISAEERDKLTSELTQRIRDEASSAKRIALAGSMFGTSRIFSPTDRRCLVEIWSESVRAEFGIDNGTAEYSARVKELADGVSKRVNRLDMRELFSALAKEIEAQGELSKTLYSYLYAFTEDELKHAPLAGIISDAGVDAIRSSPELRKKTLEFLLTPLSRDSLEQFADDMYLLKDIIDSENGSMTRSSASDEIEAEYERYSRMRFVNCVQHLYENFWAAPLGVRAVMAKELLIGPEDEREEVSQEIFDYALGKAFPQPSEDAEKAKQVVRAYIKVLPYYQRHLALAALSVAAERSQQEEVGVGEALASVLENMGPAEVVAGQNASSHSEVPYRIGKPLLRLKYLADQPERWDLTHWIEEIRPELERQYTTTLGKGSPVTISHCGKLVGSASICVDVRLSLSNGQTQILAIRRPYAEARADAGFASMKLLIDELGQSNAVAATLDELIDQSRGRLSLETNCVVAPLQYSQAEGLYNGRQVLIDGEVFYLSAAGVTAAGEVMSPKGERIGYFSMNEIPGTHFLELPEGTPAELTRKKRIALAVTTVELSNILKGKFDCDRHGGQIKIERNNIGHFDFKAMALKEWDAPGFEQVAHILTKFPFASPSIKGLSDQMLAAQREIRARGQAVHPYVTEVQKALLSIGDFTRYLDTRDLQRALLSALAAGVHKHMEAALLKSVPPMARPVLEGLLKHGRLPAGLFGDLRQADLVQITQM